MATIGIFSGRGDVVLMMLLALILGFLIGYKTKGFITKLTQKFSK